MTERRDSSNDDFLDEIVAADPANRQLAATLRSWRDDNATAPTQPDGRLTSMFAHEPAPAQPSRWRQWLQRPAIAFAASFVAVLLLGVGAFALVARSDDGGEVAAPTTSLSATEAANAASAQITLPEDLTEQTNYAGCVIEQLTGWLSAGFAAEDAPAILDECGNPPIPDLGPEAAAFRADLQTWANCAATELQSVLPDLPAIVESGEEPAGFDSCGEPPDPRDYGLELPLLDFDFETFDPSQFSFGPFSLREFDFDQFDLHGFDVPGLLEDMNLDELQARFEECLADLDRQDVPKPENLEELRDFDFSALFANLEACDLPMIAPWDMFGDAFEGLDLESLNLGDLQFEGFDLNKLLDGLDLEGVDLQNLDLDQLLADLLGDEELDLGSLFKEFHQEG